MAFGDAVVREAAGRDAGPRLRCDPGAHQVDEIPIVTGTLNQIAENKAYLSRYCAGT